MEVREIMTRDVVTVTSSTPFPELVDVLLRHDISGVPVVDPDGSLVGIVTEADLVSKEAYGGRRRRVLELLADVVAGGETGWALKGRGRVARQLMTTKVVTAGPRDDVRVAARRLVEGRVKRLPVVDDGKLVGIVSRSDVLRVLHRTDKELQRDIVDLLADVRRAPEDHAVAATVHDGIVTLRGTARVPSDLRVIVAMVWRLPGVVEVRNEATATEPRRAPTPV